MTEYLSRDHDFEFWHQPFTTFDINSSEVIEESIVKELGYGNAEYKQWFFDGIRIKHTKSYFIK